MTLSSSLVSFYGSARKVEILGLQGFLDILETQLILLQTPGVYLYPDLTVPCTGEINRAYTGNLAKIVPDIFNDLLHG
jgi:hypothetical protein